ncbi:MAG: hypothetical protein KF768_03470 [Phycisphaeraceae bacterium]|nr:hypothetical protein [Phycisphaeraceae bacterium]
MTAATTPSITSSVSNSGEQAVASATGGLRPGQRLRVTQQVVRLSGTVTGVVEGTLVRFEQQKTGSWFAHSKDGKLWLDRLELRKDDGELITLNVDRCTHIDVLGG